MDGILFYGLLFRDVQVSEIQKKKSEIEQWLKNLTDRGEVCHLPHKSNIIHMHTLYISILENSWNCTVCRLFNWKKH